MLSDGGGDLADAAGGEAVGSAGGVLPLWWAAWLISGAVAYAAGEMGSLDLLTVSALLDIFSRFTTILVVVTATRLQAHRFELARRAREITTPSSPGADPGRR